MLLKKSKEILQAQEDLMKAIQAFLKEYNHIPPNEKCMALLLAEERFLKIKQAVEEEQIQPEVLQDLLLKIINDLQILKGIQPKQEEPAVQSFTPYGIFLMINQDVEVFNNDIYTFLIRKVYSYTLGVTPQSMGDEHLDTIPKTESDEIIKSSVKNLVPIPSELEGIFNDTCDVPVCDDSSTFDALSDHSEILSNSNNDDTSSDDDDFEDIEYVSLEEVNVDQEEKDNINGRRQKCNTTTHANNSLPEYDSFLFEIEPDQGGLTSVVISDNSNDPLVELPQFESFHFDSVNSHPLFEGGEIKFLQNVEDDDSFTFVMSDFSVLPYSYLPYGDKALRPADILLYSWDGGLDVCVDLTGSSPLTRTGMTILRTESRGLTAAQRNVVSKWIKCAAIGYGFLPFSFSSLGELEANAVTLLKRIRKFSMVQDIGARAAIHIFNRISFAIAKGVGAQIVSRLPSNLL
ncbi:hypothetical protein Tco_0647447 [Tanacetum coccineum]